MAADPVEVIRTAISEARQRITGSTIPMMPSDALYATAVLAALDAAGLVLVPREPTEAMILAGRTAYDAALREPLIGPIEMTYRAMTAAAPADRQSEGISDD